MRKQQKAKQEEKREKKKIWMRRLNNNKQRRNMHQTWKKMMRKRSASHSVHQYVQALMVLNACTDKKQTQRQARRKLLKREPKKKVKNNKYVMFEETWKTFVIFRFSVHEGRKNFEMKSDTLILFGRANFYLHRLRFKIILFCCRARFLVFGQVNFSIQNWEVKP